MLIILRHSERLDEIDDDQWRAFALKLLNDPKQKRNHHSILADPPITDHGLEIAYRAGDSLTQILPSLVPSHQDSFKIRLYSSRLLRCIQTTICIAKRLGVNEIHISSGLSLTAAAVQEYSSSFDFLSIDEIRQIASEQFIIHDCDHENHQYPISPRDWYTALYDIAKHDSMNEIKIVIAHRETIRNLLPVFPRLPYCAMAICHHEKPDEASPVAVSTGQFFHIPTIFDSNGKVLLQFERR